MGDVSHGTLPDYVHDQYEEFAYVVPMIELPDQTIEAYLALDLAVVERVVRDHSATSMHANRTAA